MQSSISNNYNALKEKAQKEQEKTGKKDHIVIQVGSATCENAAGAESVAGEFRKHIIASGRKDIVLKSVGCTGRCSLEPIVSVFIPGKKLAVYCQVTRDAVHDIFIKHILEGGAPIEKYLLDTSCIISEHSKRTKEQSQLESQAITHEFFKVYGAVPFYCAQTRIALRNSGLLNPLSLYEYVAHQGFKGLVRALEKNDPVWVIDEVKKSKLRGRGGAGFPTGVKWTYARNAQEKTRYMICNADEGDPGAFMDRSMLESDPFSVIEGMIIAAFAIGAHEGFFYIRAEYPLAVKRIEEALGICRSHNLVGKNILGSGYDLELSIRLGAGAFVCGEETALIHSIEGERGQPRIRPPFPAEKGLWGQPTIINNVETLANLPVVLSAGGDEFAKIGTLKSGGTKVFAVSGNVCRTGLIEVPMGTTLREIVYDIGGGIPNGRKLKAIQTGGPAGGCIPAELIDTKVDYEDLLELGTIVGSGGLIVLDEDNCMVNMAHFFMTFSQDESCGKCTPCREGTFRMLEILNKIIAGQGVMSDIDNLERLAHLVHKASLCGLGRSAPNPILSALRYFHKEFEAHVIEKTCPAKVCKALIRYEIDPEKCIGCTMCARNCPTMCISGERKKPHFIEQSQCIKCGNCLQVCRFGAVKKI